MTMEWAEQLWRLAMPAIAVGGAAYGAYGAWIFVRQGSIVFKPTRMMIGNPASVRCRFDDVAFQAGRHTVRGWWIAGLPAHRTFLFLPGSIGNISRDLEMLALLRSAGGSVLAIDYPGFGASDGRPGERACYRAAAAAWDVLVRERRIDPSEIVVVGRSVGAAVAAWLAARRQCAALVCHSPLTSVADVAARSYPLLPTRVFCLVRFNTRRHVARCRCPVLVLHSELDTVIPIEHGYRVFERIRSPKRFLRIAGDHYGNGWNATPELRDVLHELAVGGAGAWT